MDELLLTPEERLDAEDEALKHLHSQEKVVGVDGFEKGDIAFEVRLFVAQAQLAKIKAEIEKMPNTTYFKHDILKLLGE